MQLATTCVYTCTQASFFHIKVVFLSRLACNICLFIYIKDYVVVPEVGGGSKCSIVQFFFTRDASRIAGR